MAENQKFVAKEDRECLKIRKRERTEIRTNKKCLHKETKKKKKESEKNVWKIKK